jgi:hypothetical protein
MKTEILDTADRIQSTLQHGGPLSLAALIKQFATVSGGELSMAVGWLAGGGDVRIERRGGALWVVPVSQGIQPDSTVVAALIHKIPCVLLDHGELTMASLVREIPGTTSSLAAMAVGWLARDNVVTLIDQPAGLSVGLQLGSLSLAIL